MTRPQASDAATRNHRAAPPVRRARLLPAGVSRMRGSRQTWARTSDGHDGEPEDERRFVQEQPGALTRTGDGQGHSGAQDGQRGRDHKRAEQPQQGRGRPPAYVGRCAGVVAGEPVHRGADLQHHRPDEQQPDEEVQRQQAPGPQDRHPFDGEAGEQHDAGERREPFIARCPGGTVGLTAVMRFRGYAYDAEFPAWLSGRTR